MTRWITCCLLLFGGSVAATADETPNSPLSPEAALSAFRLADEQLTIELVAAEPEVIDPVACAWDAAGRLYVVEMHDYPIGPPAGRIKQLVDDDRDGKFERVTVFAADLAFPNGVLPWRNGILVTAAPDILFLHDADDDGHAESRRTIVTGFAEGNQQLRVNGLLWGVDGWVYGANGRSDGALLRPGEDPSHAVPMRRHDFRFRPETGEVEIVTGFSQFGLARDDWGNRFLSWNTVPIRQAVLEEADLARNPELTGGTAVAQLIDPSEGARIFPISKPPQTFNRESVQHFNAGCGLALYRGNALPANYYGNAFICESLTNLVHRRVLEPVGPTFSAVRAAGEADREFLASTDSWFRPVNTTTGPDGALYVVDFYRKWVEHPQFVPGDLRDGVDFRPGDDRGRIWRIRPTGAAPQTFIAKLDQLTTSELVAQFDSANAWQRDTAQRLLFERPQAEVVQAIKELSAPLETPLGRALILRTLDVRGDLSVERLLTAVTDSSEHVRAAAVQLARRRLADCPQLRDAIYALASDESAAVRFQVALAIGDLDDSRGLSAFAGLLAQSPNDPWLRLAVLSGLKGRTVPLLAALLARRDSPATDEQQLPLFTELGTLVGAGNRDADLQACGKLFGKSQQVMVSELGVVAGIATGLEAAGTSLRDKLQLSAKEIRALQDRFPTVVAQAGQIALQRSAKPDMRLLAITVLSQSTSDQLNRLDELLDAAEPVALQTAAARAIGRSGDSVLAARSIERWPTLSISGRRELLIALSSKPALGTLVAAAIDADTIAATDIDFTARDALLHTRDPELKARFEKLLSSPANADRTAIVAQYQPATKLAGDRQRGAALFAHNCATCHAVQGVGARVGPELFGIGARPRGALLVDILDPSKDVAPDFVGYLVATVDGETKSGVLVNDGAKSITLRQPEGTEVVVLRDRIERLQSTGKSLMPDGFEQKLSVEQLADLFAFLAQPDAGLLRANR